MMINKMQTEEDITAFRNLSVDKVDEILKETSEHLLDIISNILRALLLKMNLPEDETEELVGKVKEKKMGYLFENMDKIDIQEERRKTAEERRKQEEIRKQADEERKQAEINRRKAEEERQRAEEERQKAEEERQKAQREKYMREQAEEHAVRVFIEGYQELNASRELTLAKIIEKFRLNEKIAIAKIDQYWKES